MIGTTCCAERLGEATVVSWPERGAFGHANDYVSLGFRVGALVALGPTPWPFVWT